MAKRKVLMVLDNYIKEDIEIDDKFHFDLYKDDYKDKWINLLVKVDEFDDYDSASSYFDSTFLNEEETYKNMLFILEDDNLVGTCSLWEGYHLNEKRCRVHWMAVDPKYQGKRLAKVLLYKIIDMYNKMKDDRPLYLSTSDKNLIAIIMYKSVGFIPLIQSDEDKDNWEYIDNKIGELMYG